MACVPDVLAMFAQHDVRVELVVRSLVVITGCVVENFVVLAVNDAVKDVVVCSQVGCDHEIAYIFVIFLKGRQGRLR